MKGIRKVNFYHFQGSTIVRLANTTIEDEELETKGYCICIWDMQVKMFYKYDEAKVINVKIKPLKT